jgi:hypothetical protein
MFSSVKSIQGNTMGQIFINDVNLVRFIPMKTKGEAGDALLEFIRDIGIPSEVVTDDAKELTARRWKIVAQEHQIAQRITEPYSPYQNRAEAGIRELKKAVRNSMPKMNAPQRLWDFCAIYHAEVCCYIATDLYQLHGRTPYEIVTGNTPDISEYAQYQWYEPIWFYDEIREFPHDRQTLGRWLGIAHRVGQALCYYVLRSNGSVIARTTIQPIPPEDLATEDMKVQLYAFDAEVRNHLGQPEYVMEVNPHPSSPQMIDVDETEDHLEMWENDAEMPEADNDPPEFLDNYISAHVLLLKGDTFTKGQVIVRKHDIDGNIIGKPHTNLILDSRIYEVQFEDGHIEEYAANVIAESIYAQVDDKGCEHLPMVSVHHEEQQKVGNYASNGRTRRLAGYH